MVHPPIEPFDHGSVEVTGGNTIYWQTSGDPAGKPLLFLHGGPEVPRGRGVPPSDGPGEAPDRGD